MLCGHCGKEVSEGFAACPFCGSAFSTVDPFASGGGMAPSKGTGPKKGLIVILAAAVVLLGVLIAFGPVLLNGIIKLTSSPEKYCQYVLKKNFADSKLPETIYDQFVYQRIKNQENVGLTGEISLKLSEDAMDELEDGWDVDSLEAFSDFRISYDQQKNGNQVAMAIKCSAGKDAFLTTNVIYDGDKGAVYVNIPEINEKYAKVELEDVLEDEDLDQLDQIFKNSDKLAEAFPDPKDARKMMQKYMNIIIAEIDNVKEDKEKLKIEGVEQSFTILTVEIDEKLVKHIVVALCKEAAKDKDLENMITDVADAAISLSGDSGYGRYYDDGADVWDEFAESLDEAEEDADDLDFYGWEYDLSFFVSGIGKVQGMEFSVKNDDRDAKGRMMAAYVRNGSRVAAEYIYENENSYMDEYAELVGAGKVSRGKVNMEFELKAEDEKYSFRVENLNVAALSKGKIEGDLLIDLKQFKDELSAEGMKKLKNMTLVIRVSASATENRLEIALKEEKDVFASIAISGKFEKAGAIDIPADSKCVEISDPDELAAYMEDCDFDNLADSLENLGVPEEVLEVIKNGGGVSNYINKSKIAADTQLADSVHTAVLTGMMDPEVVNNSGYVDAYNELIYGYDITQYPGQGNVILDAAAEILGVSDMSELRDRIKSPGATGSVMVTIVSSNSVYVSLEGTDDGRGDEIHVGNAPATTPVPMGGGTAPGQSGAATTAATDSGKVLNIYCWNNEFPSRLEEHYPGYQEIDWDSGRIGDVTVNFIIIPSESDNYQDTLDMLLPDNEYQYADDKIDIFLVEADYAMKYTDAYENLSMRLSDLGIDEYELYDQYEYTKDVVRDQYGDIRGVSWQASPGVLIYNREIAKKVLGSDDPATVQAAVKDWDTYNETAAKMASQGYLMTSTVQDTYRVYSSNASQPWVSGGRIIVDDNMEAWAKDSRAMLDAGYTRNDSQWSTDWDSGFSDGKVFCYFGPGWFFNFCMYGSISDNGGWGVTEGPESYFWGGTWIMAAQGTDNPNLVADIMRTMTIDEDVMLNIARNDDEFTNNRSAMERAANDSSFDKAVLGGQNPYEIMLASAEKIDMSNMTAYDYGCNQCFEDAMKAFFSGSKSYEQALQDFYTQAEAMYPELTH